MADQLALFETDASPAVPAIAGLAVVCEAVPPDEAKRLAALVDAAPLTPFQFGPWEGKRLTANYGSAYDYQRARTTDAPPVPAWLVAVCDSLAPRFGRDPHDFAQALVIRYDPGAGIGWHRDRPQYGEVIGLSLGEPCMMRLRRRRADGSFERAQLPLEPRAAYLLSGAARWEWQHSIAPLRATRRSITFRTLRGT